MQVNVEFDYKGVKKKLSETMPSVSEHEDYIRQYFGIWRVLFDAVTQIKAKSVLEFGTREGYSTKLFSEALKMTGGKITTVDINPPKEPFTEENITVITTSVEDLDWKEPVDILYIDDWHNNYHLYYELNRFSKFAKRVIIHDVNLDDLLLDAIKEWCRHNMVIYTVYPINACGFAVLEIEKSAGFFK